MRPQADWLSMRDISGVRLVRSSGSENPEVLQTEDLLPRRLNFVAEVSGQQKIFSTLSPKNLPIVD